MAPDPSDVVVVIGGALVTPFARVGRVRIDDRLNDAPNTAALTIVYTDRVGPPETGVFAAHAFDVGAFAVAFNPSPILKPPPINPGAPIAIYLGAVSPTSQIFGGHIATRDQYAEFDQPKHVRFDLSCIDYTRPLNRRKVVKEYATMSASAIVLDVVATFAPTITTANVAPGLPSISGGITFTFEEVSRALSRIAEKIGAYWYVDYVGDLHFFTGSEAGTDPAPIVPGADFANLKISADLTQVRTRVIVEGDGGTALATLTGATVVPVSQTIPFNPSGGMAKIGPARVTYTATHARGAKTNTVGIGSGGTPPPNPPYAPVATVASPTTAGGLAGGPYQYAVTFEQTDGARSTLGAPSSPVTITAAANAPATNAALPASPGKGPIAVGVASTYATTFVDGSGRETAATGGGNSVTGRAVSNPAGDFRAVGAGAGGALTPGSVYHYGCTYFTPGGETAPQFVMSTGPGSGTSLVLALPTSPDSRVVGRRLYRTSAGGVGPWRHVTDIPHNAPGTTFDDGAADGSLAPRNYPTANYATDVGEYATVTVPTSIDARVVRRRLYRADGPGSYRLVAEIPDNTSTAYNDVAIGSGGVIAPSVNRITTGAIGVSGIALGPAGTARRRVFRTTAGGAEFRELVALNDNVTTAITDTEPDANLGGSPLPSQGGAGAGAPPTAEGATQIQVAELTGLPSAGWVQIEEQLIRYTGTLTTGGFFLTGIPASGVGSITAAIPSGTVVAATPALVGVSPAVTVTLGDAVQLIAQSDDVAAQAAIAAIEGGDGVIEHYIQDRRLNESGARARGLAELALFKTIETRLSYTTHDPETRSGRTVHVDLPAPTNLTGDFLIQQVTIDDVSIAKNFFPRRAVEASTTRFSFDDVLSRLLLEQT